MFRRQGRLAELPLAAREADHAPAGRRSSDAGAASVRNEGAEKDEGAAGRCSRCGPFGHLIVKDVNAAAPGDRDNCGRAETILSSRVLTAEPSGEAERCLEAARLRCALARGQCPT